MAMMLLSMLRELGRLQSALLRHLGCSVTPVGCPCFGSLAWQPLAPHAHVSSQPPSQRLLPVLPQLPLLPLLPQLPPLLPLPLPSLLPLLSPTPLLPPLPLLPLLPLLPQSPLVTLVSNALPAFSPHPAAFEKKQLQLALQQQQLLLLPLWLWLVPLAP